MGEECSRLPGQCAVTHRTFRIEAGRYVVWILGGEVFLCVACDALDRRAAVAVANVTTEAWNRLVRSADWKISQVMVETGLPGRSVCPVAYIAVRSEPRDPVIDRNCCVVIVPVARVTVGGRVCEFQTGVTVNARDVLVLSGQFKAGIGVIELHRFKKDVPAGGGVTVGTFQVCVPVRRLLGRRTAN